MALLNLRKCFLLTVLGMLHSISEGTSKSDATLIEERWNAPGMSQNGDGPSSQHHLTQGSINSLWLGSEDDLPMVLAMLMLALSSPPVSGRRLLPSMIRNSAPSRNALSNEKQEANMNEIDAVRLCKDWIYHHVIRLGLCPFAARPFSEDRIRYIVSEATTEDDLLEDFFIEGKRLLDTPPDDIATTMLIAPHYAADIKEFSSFYEWLEDELQSDDEPILDNGIQPAFFHPHWGFHGMPTDSPINFEKRAPVPVINLLRREDIAGVAQKARAAGRSVSEDIAEHNAEALEKEGFERLSALFRRQFIT